MPYKVFILRTSGEIDVSEQPKAPDLAQLQKAVGGYIETVPYCTKLEYEGQTYSRGTCYANENGINEGLPPNVNATALWLLNYKHVTTLCGDVVFYAKINPKHIASADKSPREVRRS